MTGHSFTHEHTVALQSNRAGAHLLVHKRAEKQHAQSSVFTGVLRVLTGGTHIDLIDLSDTIKAPTGRCACQLVCGLGTPTLFRLRPVCRRCAHVRGAVARSERLRNRCGTRVLAALIRPILSRTGSSQPLIDLGVDTTHHSLGRLHVCDKCLYAIDMTTADILCIYSPFALG